MKRGEMYWHQKYGLVVLGDPVVENDPTIAVGAWTPPKTNQLRTAIVNESDLVPVKLSDAQERFRELVIG